MYTINPLSKANLLLHTPKISNVFPELTSTELVTLMLYSSGLKSPRMGELMNVSKKTINSHIENIRVKFQLDNYEEVKQVFELRITLNVNPDRYKDLFLRSMLRFFVAWCSFAWVIQLKKLLIGGGRNWRINKKANR